MRPPQNPRVIIRHCHGYDPEQIRRIVREGLEELNLRPYGHTLLKPNLVAAGPLFQHAHTRPEFTEGDAVPPKKFDFEPARGPRPQEGYIGLENHSDDDGVCFKEVAVKMLKK